jgi:hypothetical protein
MSKQKKAVGWDEVIQDAGERPKGYLEKEALAKAQGRGLPDLPRGVTQDLVTTFQAGEKAARTRAEA